MEIFTGYDFPSWRLPFYDGGTPNHPVVIDDHELVLKLPW